MLLAALSGTCHAAGCGLVRTGTTRAYGTGFLSPYASMAPGGGRRSPTTTTSPWYDSGMTQKIAVSLPDEQVVSIRRAVEQGRAPSVSGFISAAVARVQREDDLAQLLDDLDRELGPVDDADLVWADKALGLV